jgi:hypothetical protein
MKRPSDHHSSIVIITEPTGKFLMTGGYDEGYKHTQWHNTANPLGGNFERGDVSPRALLDRELGEELSSMGLTEGFARAEFIDTLRRRILAEVTPHSDFYIRDPRPPTVPADAMITSVVSSYFAILPTDLLLEAREWLRLGRRISREGLINVLDVGEVLAGRPLFAWSSPVMVGHFLDRNVPNPYCAHAEAIGKPRDNFQAYLEDFTYRKPVVSAA